MPDLVIRPAVRDGLERALIGEGAR